MFRPFRQLLAALHEIAVCLVDLTSAVHNLRQVQQDQGPATERLALLEQSRHQFEALCEGLLLKAEGKLRAANNAEARERANKKSYEHLLDPLAEVGDEPETPAGNPDDGHHAAPGQAEGMPPVRVDVAPSGKTLAQRAKFGVR